MAENSLLVGGTTRIRSHHQKTPNGRIRCQSQTVKSWSFPSHLWSGPGTVTSQNDYDIHLWFCDWFRVRSLSQDNELKQSIKKKLRKASRLGHALDAELVFSHKLLVFDSTYQDADHLKVRIALRMGQRSWACSSLPFCFQVDEVGFETARNRRKSQIIRDKIKAKIENLSEFSQIAKRWRAAEKYRLRLAEIAWRIAEIHIDKFIAILMLVICVHEVIAPINFSFDNTDRPIVFLTTGNSNFLSHFLVQYFQVNAVNIPYIICISISLPMQEYANFTSAFAAVWTSIVIVFKMLFQTKFIDEDSSRIFCTVMLFHSNVLRV